MDALSLSLQNLRIAQFLTADRSPTPSDLTRLRRGLDFLRRTRSAYSFVTNGDVEHLEESSFAEARYAARTLAALKTVRNIPEVAKHLQCLEDALAGLVERDRPLSPDQRSKLQRFFSSIGKALLTDAIDSQPVLDLADAWEPGQHSKDGADYLGVATA